MNSKIVAMTASVVLVSGFIFIMPLTNTGCKAFAQTSPGNQSATSKSNTTSTGTNGTTSFEILNFTRAVGTIASIQNNETGKPTWVLSGFWRLLIPEPLQVTTSHPPSSAIFHAVFEMIKTNGKEMHSHSIYGFKLTHASVDKTGIVLNGTATVTGPPDFGTRTDVPISVSVLNEGTMSLWIDPTKTNNHFGNTPIYGTVSRIGIFLESPPILLTVPG
jgi:hypothetical protein